MSGLSLNHMVEHNAGSVRGCFRQNCWHQESSKLAVFNLNLSVKEAVTRKLLASIEIVVG
ncbi:hypothetical protein BT93_H2769 [Corymbia citriodora subsp. variegata]|nr:hypothetical protein BT93_H2769 [Corymbia citriodora subsp. variegata]